MLAAEQLHSAKEPTESSARAFKRERLLNGAQTLELVSLEASYITDESITPADWEDQITDVVNNADVVFVEYFPPELEKNIPYLDELGSFSKDIAEVYGTIAATAHRLGKPVAVADIANRPLYEMYNFGLYPLLGAAAVASARQQNALGKIGFIAGEAYLLGVAYQAAKKRGTYGVQPGFLEHLTPTANDARRALTARGIAQTAQALPPNTSLAYIAAPAHINRVKAALTAEKTISDSVKAAAYKRLAGLDRTTRIYMPTNGGWELSSSTPIR